MQITPVQQTPLPFEPARQQLTPPPPVNPTPAPQPATPAVTQSATPQDKFQQGGGGGSGGQSGSAATDQQQQAVTQQLQAAYQQLQQLKQQASQALAAGDSKAATQAAQEAAQVAVSIENITGAAPDVGLAAIEIEVQQISAQNSTSSQSSTPSQLAAVGEQPTVIDLARAGLGTANDVVDTAASVPTHQVADRQSISGYKQTVLQAMAGVEAIAARLLGTSGSASAGSTATVDISA